MSTFKKTSIRIATITLVLTGILGVNAFAQQTTNQQGNNQQNNNQQGNNQQNNNQQNGNQQGSGQANNMQRSGANMGFPGDTITYVINGSDLSFDSKRTLMYDDKHTVDSLVRSLIAHDNKKYRIIYKKQGQLARQISVKDLAKINRASFYKVTVAYNKQQLSEDPSPLYILSAK